MDGVVFYLGNQKQNLVHFDPNGSVLDYLRLTSKMTGTKEGCGSGDCGACTAVLVEATDSGLSYTSVNSCITPVATLHGKQLLTVEHLKQGDILHPVQQAMVACHGSQCGFCTPGFIMSMFAYRKNNGSPKRESIVEALGGNLCRCTGYRPIIDAAIQMYEVPLDDHFSKSNKKTVQELAAITKEDVKIDYLGKEYLSPTSLDSLTFILQQHPQARLLAGGTDLCLEITQHLKQIPFLVYLGRVPELLILEETETTIFIGGAVSYSQCQSLLLKYFPDLHSLFDRLGSKQIRNQATVGGNVANASPVGDMPPILIVLEAQLLLRKGSHTRIISVENFFIDYKLTALQESEFIEKIIIPKPEPGYQLRVYKISKRLEDDISASCAAINIKVDAGNVVGVNIAFGGMAAIPKRAAHCENALITKPWQQETIVKAQQALDLDFTPLSDFRASSEYRMQVSKNLLQRLFFELESEPKHLRVTHYA